MGVVRPPGERVRGDCQGAGEREGVLKVGEVKGCALVGGGVLFKLLLFPYYIFILFLIFGQIKISFQIDNIYL